MVKTAAIVPYKEKIKLVKGDLTEEQFIEFVEKQKESFSKIDSVEKDATKKTMPIYHKIGAELIGLFKVSKPKTAIIKQYGEIVNRSETTLYRALKLAELYTEEQVKSLVQRGNFHMGHIEHLLRIDKPEDRKLLEDKIADEGLSTRATKAAVDELAEKDGDILTPSAKKRKQERATSKRNDLTNPVKAVPKCMSSLAVFTDSCANLIDSFANLSGVLHNDPVRKGVLRDLEDLVEEATANKGLFDDLAEAVQKQIKELKAVKNAK